MNLTEKIKTGVDQVRTYWKTPMAGRYMTFREIAAYSGGGIGAYMIITLGTACLLAVNNVLISSALGVDPTDMYLMYVIAVLANIPLTGIRANIIDNTRNKAGKYRPYIVTMAIPTAIICVLMVWFPYKSLDVIFGSEPLFMGKSGGYIAKCAVIMVLNLLLHFFYYFFFDAYENLIHVLSPNSQERADVSSVKSVVYSLAPTIVNLLTPIIAQNIFHTNTTDIRVYRFLYPILGVLGVLLCIIVYKYTEEKIVQARTHVVQIKFSDALRAVAKNKYFWIISLAGWIGFLEGSYSNILNWLYNYGGACSGNVFGLVVTLYGNSSLWGMLLAPFCIRRWGKKAVLVITNIFNIICILMMLPFTSNLDSQATIWLVMGAMYFNGFMGSFAHILNPAIQADIRDYQQYKTGERIDGMFAAVGTIGTVIALVTSSVLPFIYEKGGITEAMAKKVTSNPEILNRVLGDGKSVGVILQEQLANGQNNYTNAYSALYDLNILENLLHVLIIVSAFGALLNVIPYFWYDFDERKQKSVVRVLKVRALFEDYGNGALNDGQLVEAVDVIRDAKEMAVAQPKDTDKSIYKNQKDKALRKAAKKQYRANLEYNEEIEVSKFVCAELDKFSTDLMKHQVAVYQRVYDEGLKGLYNSKMDDLVADYKKAKAMPKSTQAEKELRAFAIEVARNKKSARKAIDKYYPDFNTFVEPDFAVLDALFDKEDELDAKIQKLYNDLRDAKKAKDADAIKALKTEIKKYNAEVKIARDNSKKEMDKHAFFGRAAKPYLDAKRLMEQKENYSHFEEIAAKYDDAKVRFEADEARKKAEAEKLDAEEKALRAKIKAEKAAKKAAKKNK